MSALYWCERCGMIWTANDPPICRHYATDVPASVMVSLPLWHPYAQRQKP